MCSFLVGGFNPSEKYWSNWIISPKFGMNIQKSVSCHHPVYYNPQTNWVGFHPQNFFLTNQGPPPSFQVSFPHTFPVRFIKPSYNFDHNTSRSIGTWYQVGTPHHERLRLEDQIGSHWVQYEYLVLERRLGGILPRTVRKWWSDGPPMYWRHEVRSFGRGCLTTRSLGDLWSPLVINHWTIHWDDPSSRISPVSCAWDQWWFVIESMVVISPTFCGHPNPYLDVPGSWQMLGRSYKIRCSLWL